MAFQSQMTGGYPAEADIDTELAALAIELATENNPNYIAEHKQQNWGIVKALRAFISLSVYPASATTFDVRGGDYLYKGTVKTYTPGAAVDPTDNDTTYVWLRPDNTIGSGIDADGWPVIEHIKLAEIDVDADGVITAVRDKRGRAFLQRPDAPAEIAAETVCKDNQVICKNNEIVLKGV